MDKLNRRDFLKLAGAISASLVVRRALPDPLDSLDGQPEAPNVIIILFDAMSAKNLSIYGYDRQTTPNLERFANRATVYHQHFSAGNYTTPGTASLLTGMYPWAHRAINQSGLIKRTFERRNLFSLYGPSHQRVAFAQNMWANVFLNQFGEAVDVHLPPDSFSDVSRLVGEDFTNDTDPAFRAFDDSLLSIANTPSSLIFGTAARLRFARQLEHAQGKDYPRGLPGLVDYPVYFRLGTVFDGLIDQFQKLATPYLAYFHVWSPHEPYRPHSKFANAFNDDVRFVAKPAHPLGDETPQDSLDRLRRRYDQYIANVDHEFGRLLDHLQQTGVLDRSYVIVTSDHGQMFERGVHGHVTPLLYDPVIHVPLLISVPGQVSRRDIYSPSVNIDVLPTLLQLAGITIPDWCAGQVLESFSTQQDQQRSIFSMDAKTNSAFGPITRATIAMRKGPLKLIGDFGYRGFEEVYELYDIETDPEELRDLAAAQPAEFGQMKEELLDALADANRSYEKN